MWVAVTKLLVKTHGDQEDTEKCKDYLAMHLYSASEPGKKTLSASDPLVKSLYINEQTFMLYNTHMKIQQVLNPGMLLNLVLDQTGRSKDLYFKVEIFCNLNFNAQSLNKRLAFCERLEVPTLPLNGGRPSCPFFYKNPQFWVQVDPERVVHKANLGSLRVDT